MNRIETYKSLWDFEFQTDHLIAVRGPDQIIINKLKKKNPKRIADKWTLPSQRTTD